MQVYFGRILPSENRASVKKIGKDINVVAIDFLFLFLFVLVLCFVYIRTNVVFLVKKTLVLGGTNKKQCGVRRFLSFSRGG